MSFLRGDLVVMLDHELRQFVNIDLHRHAQLHAGPQRLQLVRENGLRGQRVRFKIDARADMAGDDGFWVVQLVGEVQADADKMQKLLKNRPKSGPSGSLHVPLESAIKEADDEEVWSTWIDDGSVTSLRPGTRGVPSAVASAASHPRPANKHGYRPKTTVATVIAAAKADLNQCRENRSHADAIKRRESELTSVLEVAGEVSEDEDTLEQSRDSQFFMKRGHLDSRGANSAKMSRASSAKSRAASTNAFMTDNNPYEWKCSHGTRPTSASTAQDSLTEKVKKKRRRSKTEVELENLAQNSMMFQKYFKTKPKKNQ